LGHSSCGEEEAPEEEDLDSDTQIIVKTVMLIVIGLLTFLASLLPWAMRKIKYALDVMYLGAAFASGVIIGLALSHTIPGAQEAFNSYFALAGTDDLLDPEDAAYPFAELIVGGTLILLIGIDKVIVHRGLSGHNHKESPDHGHNHMVVDLPKGAENDISKIRGGDYHAGQAWIFFVALSIHSIFDGFSLGAESTETGLTSVIIAILAHKLLDGFSLGVPVYLAKFPLWKSMSFLIFCACMTPLGIIVAMVTVEVNDGADAALVRGIFLACSAGSFLFISLVELLPSSLADGRWAAGKWIALLLGWTLMVIIAIWA
jgi:zinc transporter 1/2/3